MSVKRKALTCKVENVEEEPKLSVLDLPELALDCILERLPSDALCSMAGVCSSLRERCTSDHFWEKHMKQKWGRIIGPAAYREWQWHLATRTSLDNSKQGKQKGLLRILYLGWPFSWMRAKAEDNTKQRCSLPVDSIMAWYLALESGKFCFPAQVYNREVHTMCNQFVRLFFGLWLLGIRGIQAFVFDLVSLEIKGFCFYLPEFSSSWLFCRMAMLVLCCHAMMLRLAMTLALEPSKPGNCPNCLSVLSAFSDKILIFILIAFCFHKILLSFAFSTEQLCREVA